MQKINVHKLIDSRPPNTGDLIFRAMEKVNCLACGKCCTEGAGRLFVQKYDPISEPLRRSLGSLSLKTSTNSKFKVVRSKSGFEIRSSTEDKCSLLQEPTNVCSVYDNRPVRCGIFPFSVQIINGVERVVLSSMCPPLKDLKEAGVGIILTSDIVFSVSDIYRNPTKFTDEMVRRAAALYNGQPVLVSTYAIKDPILTDFIGSALVNLQDAISKSLLGTSRTFFNRETGEVVFPII